MVKQLDHSPTPWQTYTKTATSREPYSILDADGNTIAVILWRPQMETEEAEANAHLIVDAVNAATGKKQR